uniref:RNA-binding protein NOB1 n=1 Tax=Timema shepardi TaxID=629360 RepID=A0A7R9G522_TIMSH|nr:unnamed protein product [Timema shepardi]
MKVGAVIKSDIVLITLIIMMIIITTTSTTSYYPFGRRFETDTNASGSESGQERETTDMMEVQFLLHPLRTHTTFEINYKCMEILALVELKDVPLAALTTFARKRWTQQPQIFKIMLRGIVEVVNMEEVRAEWRGNLPTLLSQAGQRFSRSGQLDDSCGRKRSYSFPAVVTGHLSSMVCHRIGHQAYRTSRRSGMRYEWMSGKPKREFREWNGDELDVGKTILTIQEVVDEITNKRQLRRLVVLPYDLQLKDVFQENIKYKFSKKTGDYPSLSATDIKVIALTFQLEKEKVGIDHLQTEPKVNRVVSFTKNNKDVAVPSGLAGFYLPKKLGQPVVGVSDVIDKADTLTSENKDILSDVEDVSSETHLPGNLEPNCHSESEESEAANDSFEDAGDAGRDFAMQNVMKQLGLNVLSVNGRMIRQLRTFILRCYACFKTTSIMTKMFCPNCGNKTLKKVAVSLKEDGTQQIHINARRPLTARGKRPDEEYALSSFLGSHQRKARSDALGASQQGRRLKVHTVHQRKAWSRKGGKLRQ